MFRLRLDSQLQQPPGNGEFLIFCFVKAKLSASLSDRRAFLHLWICACFSSGLLLLASNPCLAVVHPADFFTWGCVFPPPTLMKVSQTWGQHKKAAINFVFFFPAAPRLSVWSAFGSFWHLTEPSRPPHHQGYECIFGGGWEGKNPNCCSVYSNLNYFHILLMFQPQVSMCFIVNLGQRVMHNVELRENDTRFSNKQEEEKHINYIWSGVVFWLRNCSQQFHILPLMF